MNKLRITMLCFGVALTSMKVFSCECKEAPPVAEAKQRVKAVFLGTVISVSTAKTSSNMTEKKALFKAVRWWQGNPQNEVAVYTATSHTACGFSFTAGHSYLVYAYQSQGNNFLETSSCDRTKSEKAAENDIRELGPSIK